MNRRFQQALLLSLALLGCCVCLQEEGPHYGEFRIASHADPPAWQVDPAALEEGAVRVSPGELFVDFEHDGHLITLRYEAISECEALARARNLREYRASLDTAADTADTGFDARYWVCEVAYVDRSEDCCDSELPESS